jgi:hypothetical protein
MKNYLYIIIVFFLFASYACRHKKEVVQITTITVPAQQVNSAPPNVIPDTATKSRLCRLVLSFYSIGEGPDMDAYRKMQVYIDDYQQQHHVSINTERHPWGREGEMNICVRLNQLTEQDQRTFIDSLKMSLSSARWIHYFENQEGHK